MAGCPKNKSTGNPVIFGGDACKFEWKRWVRRARPPVIVHRRICIECGMDITLHGLLKKEEDKLIKPAVLPPLKKSATR